jgi:ATP/maltotriose-dependent transcriptional regulator MalT
VLSANTDVTSKEMSDHPPTLEQSQHLLRTKLYIPPIRPNQIPRPRLSGLIHGGLDRALILVSAPAGYGKTTLVSSWLKEMKSVRPGSRWMTATMTRSDSCST